MEVNDYDENAELDESMVGENNEEEEEDGEEVDYQHDEVNAESNQGPHSPMEDSDNDDVGNRNDDTGDQDDNGDHDDANGVANQSENSNDVDENCDDDEAGDDVDDDELMSRHAAIAAELARMGDDDDEQSVDAPQSPGSVNEDEDSNGPRSLDEAPQSPEGYSESPARNVIASPDFEPAFAPEQNGDSNIEQYSPGASRDHPVSPGAYNPESPGYNPTSPADNPESPGYNPTSPADNAESPGYVPTSPADNPESPGYNPTSPVDNPESPAYIPTSPTYNPASPGGDNRPTSSDFDGPQSPDGGNVLEEQDYPKSPEPDANDHCDTTSQPANVQYDIPYSPSNAGNEDTLAPQSPEDGEENEAPQSPDNLEQSDAPQSPDDLGESGPRSPELTESETPQSPKDLGGSNEPQSPVGNDAPQSLNDIGESDAPQSPDNASDENLRRVVIRNEEELRASEADGPSSPSPPQSENLADEMQSTKDQPINDGTDLVASPPGSPLRKEDQDEREHAVGNIEGSPVRGRSASPIGSPMGSRAGSPIRSGAGSPMGSRAGSPIRSGPGSPMGSRAGSPIGSRGGSPIRSGAGSPMGSRGGSPIGSRGGSPMGSKGGSPKGSRGGSPMGSRDASPVGSPRHEMGVEKDGDISDADSDIIGVKRKRPLKGSDDDDDESDKGSAVGELIADIFGPSDEEEEFEGFGADVESQKKKDQKSIDEGGDKASGSGDKKSGDDSSDEELDRGKGFEDGISDFERMLMKKKEENQKRRRKRKDVDIINDNDDLIDELVKKMKEAAEEDRQHNQDRKPAVKKLKMLPEVVLQLKKADLHMAFLDGGILNSMTEWLAPLPDKSLPHLQIREAVLKQLVAFPSISTEGIKLSGIGKAVMYLAKHPKEIRINKDIAMKLINEWSRPIFNLTSNYKNLSREEREQRDYEQLPKKRRISLEGGPSNQDIDRALAGNEKVLRPGDPGYVYRARVPTPSTKDYVIRPKWTVEEKPSKGASKKELTRYEKCSRSFADKKRKSAYQASKMSIEGRNMTL